MSITISGLIESYMQTESMAFRVEPHSYASAHSYSTVVRFLEQLALYNDNDENAPIKAQIVVSGTAKHGEMMTYYYGPSWRRYTGADDADVASADKETCLFVRHKGVDGVLTPAQIEAAMELLDYISGDTSGLVAYIRETYPRRTQ